MARLATAVVAVSLAVMAVMAVVVTVAVAWVVVEMATEARVVVVRAGAAQVVAVRAAAWLVAGATAVAAWAAATVGGCSRSCLSDRRSLHHARSTSVLHPPRWPGRRSLHMLRTC